MSAHDTTMDSPMGPPHVHHMDSTTAYHAAKLGIWLFLATEVLLFGGLFAGFAIYRWMYPEAFLHASHHLNVWAGAGNTLVLLFSSWLAAVAVTKAQQGDNKAVVKLFSGTIVCALIFLVVKYFEYHHKWEMGLFPFFGAGEHAQYSWNSPEFNQEFRTYFGLYYCMTMLHALHVIIGMGILVWGLLLAKRNRFSAEYYTPIEVGALYWHLVDLIWIYLFPLLYLVGEPSFSFGGH